jgi:AcrR family transcriptional regulator
VTDQADAGSEAQRSRDVGRRPRQRRAVETRQRLYEIAVAEYERVGIDAARLEDIVESAGVSWSTFFDYFQRKEDVLQEAGVGMAAALAKAVEDGLADSEKPVGEVFRASLRAATDAAPGPQVRGALLGDIVNNPGRMTAYLADRGCRRGWTPRPGYS